MYPPAFNNSDADYIPIDNPIINEEHNSNRATKKQESDEILLIIKWLLAFILAVYLITEVILFALPSIISVEYEKKTIYPLLKLTGKKSNKLQIIADKLKPVMEFDDKIPINIHIGTSENKDDINAFATFGGQIFILPALIDKLPNEESLAFVIAHEMAHIKHRDILKASSRQIIWASILLAINLPIDTTLINMLSATAYSRAQESKADAAAFNAVLKTYGTKNNSLCIFDIFEELESKSNTKIPEWLSTHPDSKARRNELLNQMDREFENSSC